jgi:hypothetical protein
MRPRYGTPKQVVANLKGIFRDFKEQYENATLSVAGNVYPLGGHIHVGVGTEFCPPSGLLRLLDDFLGRPTLSMSGLARGSYGREAAWEAKPWGFEYRTPPAAIFANPQIARICMKITHNLTKRFCSGKSTAYDLEWLKAVNDVRDIKLPREQDYLAVGLTRGETHYFRYFLLNYHASVPKDHILAAWGVEEPKLPEAKPDGTPDTEYRVHFSDTWVSAVRIELLSQVSEMARLFKRNITLYGVAESRGDVASIEVPGVYAAVELLHVCTFEGSTVRIGLPWSFRNDSDCTNVACVVNAIRAFLTMNLREDA